MSNRRLKTIKLSNKRRTWVIAVCTPEVLVSVDLWIVWRISCRPSCCGVHEAIVKLKTRGKSRGGHRRVQVKVGQEQFSIRLSRSGQTVLGAFCLCKFPKCGHVNARYYAVATALKSCNQTTTISWMK